MSRPAGRIRSHGGTHWADLPALAEAGLTHGFSCRTGDPEADGRQLAAALGIADLPRARLRQQHTALVHRGRAGGQPEPPPVGDALCAGEPGVALSLSTADCLPLLLLDADAGAFAAVHAGWRGTLSGILPTTIQRMQEELGARTEHLRIGVGPAIRACCYEVGPEVWEAFARAWPGFAAWRIPGGGSRAHLDLVAANRGQAAALGVADAAWIDGGWCTRCRQDRFWSYRAHGAGAGRILTLAARR